MAPICEARNSRGLLQLNSWPSSPEDERRLDGAVWAFVMLGIALRLMRYLLRFPLWGDECMVATNFLDRDYAGMAGQLDYNQICPLWFMWTELTSVKLFGFHEWSLRLFPTLCSVASLFLFRHVARRLLNGVPLLLAVGVFCVAYYPIRHGAELKPYAPDLCVALTVLALTIEWLQSGESRFGWWLTAFLPLGLGFSYPAVFVAGAASAAVAIAIWQSRIRRAWPAWIVFNAVLGGTSLAFYLAVAHAQSAAARAGGINDMWVQSFPPLATPWKLPLWLLDVHVGRMLAYPAGGEHGASLLTTVCCLLGAAIFWRRLDRWVSCLLLGPFALGLVGAFAGAYPYGGSARTMQYVAPSICLLTGLGAAALLAVPRWNWMGTPARRLAVAVGILVAVGLASGIRDLVHPYKTAYDLTQHSFARWLWQDLGRDGQVACVVQDLGVPLFPWAERKAIMPDYRCFQRIFSARHKHGPCPPVWDQITVDRPLWCVIQGYKGSRPDPAALSSWLVQMSADYDLAGTVRLPVCAGGGVVFDQWYELYRFVPKGSLSTSIQAELPRQPDGVKR